ncbi:MAG TPA: hypothetical protein VNW92_00270, partial [Polyangiaceae bacterium]|nr:hypothetical protein [Polyangiaceae bacterium]
ALNVLGIPLKHGDGPHSTRLDILTPTLTLEPPPSEPGHASALPPLPHVAISLLLVAGDPADIGAQARRVVHATVQRLSVEPAPSKAE